MIETLTENIHVLIPALILALLCLSWLGHRKWQRETEIRKQITLRRAVAVVERRYTDADHAVYEAMENRSEQREAA